MGNKPFDAHRAAQRTSIVSVLVIFGILTAAAVVLTIVNVSRGRAPGTALIIAYVALALGLIALLFGLIRRRHRSTD